MVSPGGSAVDALKKQGVPDAWLDEAAREHRLLPTVAADHPGRIVEPRLAAAREPQLAAWTDAVLDPDSLAELFAEPSANH